MEIIKKGKLPGERERTVECGQCGTTFKAKDGEGQTWQDQRENDSGVKFKCPLPGCNNTVWVSDQASDYWRDRGWGCEDGRGGAAWVKR